MGPTRGGGSYFRPSVPLHGQHCQWAGSALGAETLQYQVKQNLRVKINFVRKSSRTFPNHFIRWLKFKIGAKKKYSNV